MACQLVGMMPRLAARPTRRQLFRAFTALASSLLCVALPAHAQFPEKFTNLKFFPKDISSSDLMQTMRGFSFALGTRCEHCHVQSSGGRFDFADDSKQP